MQPGVRRVAWNLRGEIVTPLAQAAELTSFKIGISAPVVGGQVVVREQAQITRAPGRREQDRRMHAGLADGMHELALLGAHAPPRDLVLPRPLGAAMLPFYAAYAPNPAVLLKQGAG